MRSVVHFEIDCAIYVDSLFAFSAFSQELAFFRFTPYHTIAWPVAGKPISNCCRSFDQFEAFTLLPQRAEECAPRRDVGLPHHHGPLVAAVT